jgi:hypothetical protein
MTPLPHFWNSAFPLGFSKLHPFEPEPLFCPSPTPMKCSWNLLGHIAPSFLRTPIQHGAYATSTMNLQFDMNH